MIQPENNRVAPPRTAVCLLHFSLPESTREPLLGDLWEEHGLRTLRWRSKLRADGWFWLQTLRALWHWLFKGSLVLLAAVLILLFFTSLSFTFLAMSGQERPFGLSAPLGVPALMITAFILARNRAVLQDLLSSFRPGCHSLSQANLRQIQRLLGLLRQSIQALIAVCVIVAIGNQFADLPAVPANLAQGLTWMLFVHTFALYSLLGLLEERVVEDMRALVASE